MWCTLIMDPIQISLLARRKAEGQTALKKRKVSVLAVVNLAREGTIPERTTILSSRLFHRIIDTDGHRRGDGHRRAI